MCPDYCRSMKDFQKWVHLRERDVFSWVVRWTNVDIWVPFPLCAASTGRLSFPLSPALASYSSSCALLSLLKAGIPKCKKLPQSGPLNNLGVLWQVFLRYGFKTHNTRNENLLQYISGLLYKCIICDFDIIRRLLFDYFNYPLYFVFTSQLWVKSN